METLLLNASFQPLDLCNWKRVMTLLSKDKIEVVETNGRKINNKIDLPSVIRLKKFVFIPFTSVPITRLNVMHRDNYTCQYCGSNKNLTIDHVKPKSKGGTHTWDNVVAACVRCNTLKDNKELKDTNFKLKKVPKEPKSSERYKIAKKLKSKELKENWDKYF